MRSLWPSKNRVAGDRDANRDRFARGDARPDFLCIGAKKAGTSWLYHQLSSHPDFWMPPVKELHYFDHLSRTPRRNPPRCRDERDASFMEGLTRLGSKAHIDLENYSRLFEVKGTLVCGDITPTYSMLNDEMIQKIVDTFPDLKVIFLARDPVERAWSHLSMETRLGTIGPFDETDIDEVMQNLLKPGVFYCSYPSKTVARWRRCVRPELFQVYFFDDLEENPAELRRSILQFLGADPDKSNGKISPGQNNDADKKKLQLSDQVRSRLGHFFQNELKSCAEELGGRAREWPARYGF